MDIGGYKVDFTFGPVFTVLVAPIIIYYVSKVIDRVFNELSKASEDRHKHVVDAIEDSKKTFMAKLDAHCAIQEKLHKQIDERFWKHGHTMDENGKMTDDIVIKGGGM